MPINRPSNTHFIGSNPTSPQNKIDLSVWGMGIRFAFLPMAKIKVSTSVCTGRSKCPPDTCTAKGSNPPSKYPYQTKNTSRKAGVLVWWGMVDSNHRRHSQQIYSLSPLATREIPHMKLLCRLLGAGRRTRTPDLLITNQLLYQLSYTGGSNRTRLL